MDGGNKPMKYNFKIEEAVRNRYSVRTFDKTAVEEEIKENILSYAEQLKNPLGPGIKIQFIEKGTASNGEKLGTYGIIKGAQSYLAVTIPKDEYALEALGYEFEQLVLYITSLGLGTCWLGGTFNRNAFTSVVEIKEDEIFPILSPIGYPARKKRVSEQLFRRTLNANGRKPWSELFFQDEFENPLSKEAAGDYQFPLEMLRLAPSAVNKQPWRVVVSENAVHFFEKHSLGKEGTGVDMQRIDVGIGICHFHLVAMERKLHGRFERKCPDIAVPQDMTYIVSWINQ